MVLFNGLSIDSKVKQALVSHGIGTFHERSVTAGHVVSGRHKALVHQSPTGNYSVAEVVTNRYSSGDTFQIFEALQNVCSVLGVPNESQEVTVNSWTNADDAPIKVRVSIDLKMPLTSPQRGDLYSVRATATEHYGTGKSSSMGLELLRVSCSNLEIFDLDSIWSASVKHVGDYDSKVMSLLPPREVIESKVTGMLQTLEGTELKVLHRGDFLMALHYALHGQGTSSRLLQNTEKHKSMDHGCYSNSDDIYAEPILSEQGTRIGWTDTESGHEATSRELSKTISVYHTHAPTRASEGPSSEDRGLSLFGLRQAVTRYLTSGGSVDRPAEVGGKKTRGTVNDVAKRLDIINRRFVKAFEDHRQDLRQVDGGLSQRLPFNLIPSNRNWEGVDGKLLTPANNTETFFSLSNN